MKVKVDEMIEQHELIRPFFLERDYGATWLAFETLPV